MCGIAGVVNGSIDHDELRRELSSDTRFRSLSDRSEVPTAAIA